MKKDLLTPREKEVMKLLIHGYFNPKISEILCISKHTTKSHMSSIFEKLKVSNRVEAAVRYLQEYGYNDFDE